MSEVEPEGGEKSSGDLEGERTAAAAVIIGSRAARREKRARKGRGKGEERERRKGKG